VAFDSFMGAASFGLETALADGIVKKLLIRSPAEGVAWDSRTLGRQIGSVP
jgi:hypothetical protein